jgi:hypothetical protein
MTKQPDPSLDTLQRWMQAVITHPWGVAAGATSAEAQAEIQLAQANLESIVTPSRALTAAERLEIYNRSYFARLLECMRAEYSVLAAALGEDLFDSFALGYLQSHPPQSYTLAELGNRFPEYLAATRPATDERPDPHAASDETDWPEFLIDLARLERTINTVFDGPGAEGERLVDRDRLAAIAPDRWPGARLVCVPCLQLLALRYPVNDYFTAVRRGEPAEFPERAPGYLAITRRDYRVYRYALTRVQYEMLRALSAGETVEAAIAQGAQTSSKSDEEFAAELRESFFAWATSGFFGDVIV